MSNRVIILTVNELEQMHTGSLIRRLEDLRKCEESFESSDRYGVEDGPRPADTGYVEFKNTQEWKDAYSEVKKILAHREHLPKGEERKARRKERIETTRSFDQKTVKRKFV